VEVYPDLETDRVVLGLADVGFSPLPLYEVIIQNFGGGATIG